MPILDWFIDNNPQKKSYNITPDCAISLYDLAIMVRDISNSDVPILIKNEGLGLEYSGDNTLLKNEYTTICFTPIRTAIQELYSWYRENKQLIQKDLLLTDK